MGKMGRKAKDDYINNIKVLIYIVPPTSYLL